MKTGAAVAFLVFCFSLTAGTSEVWCQEPKKQEWNYRGEVYGSAGYGRFYHGDHFWGGGLEIGGGLGFRPFPGAFPRLGFEAQFLRSNHFVQESSTHSNEGDAFSVAANAVYHFSNSRIQPYVSGGVGVMKTNFTHRGISEWFDSAGHHIENRVHHARSSKSLVNVGVGFKAAIGKHYSIRPELRLLTTTPGKGPNFGSPRFSIGVGYHF